MAKQKLEKTIKEYAITTLVNNLKNGTINREAEMQRSFVWKLPEQTEFLDSVFHPEYFIPALIGAETEKAIDINGKGKMEYIIDLLDGVQRITTLEKFFKGEIRLGNNISPIIIEQDDESEIVYNIAGMTYEELPEQVKQIFRNCRIQMIYFKNMSPKDRERQFLKLNAGKKLNNAEINKARIGQTIREYVYKQLATPLWTNFVKVTASRDIKFETLIQALMLLSDEKELSGKAIAKFAEEANVAHDVFEQLEVINDYLNKTVKRIKIIMFPDKFHNLTEKEIIDQLDEKGLKKWYKPIDFLKKVNVPIIFVLAKTALHYNIDENKFAEFVYHFFTKDANYERYHRYTTSNSADITNVQGRIKTITDSFNKYFNVSEMKLPVAQIETETETETEKQEIQQEQGQGQENQQEEVTDQQEEVTDQQEEQTNSEQQEQDNNPEIQSEQSESEQSEQGQEESDPNQIEIIDQGEDNNSDNEQQEQQDQIA